MIPLLLAAVLTAGPNTLPLHGGGKGGGHLTRADLAFADAVERFVMAAGATGLASATPPEPFRRLIEDLGSDCWLYREASSKRIERACRTVRGEGELTLCGPPNPSQSSPSQGDGKGGVPGNSSDESALTANLRWLMWGRQHRDPEIRLRCNAALRRLTVCGPCEGHGICLTLIPNPEDEDRCVRCGRESWWHTIESAPPCIFCRGTGATWCKGAFD